MKLLQSLGNMCICIKCFSESVCSIWTATNSWLYFSSTLTTNSGEAVFYLLQSDSLSRKPRVMLASSLCCWSAIQSSQICLPTTIITSTKITIRLTEKLSLFSPPCYDNWAVWVNHNLLLSAVPQTLKVRAEIWFILYILFSQKNTLNYILALWIVFLLATKSNS